MLKIQLLYVCQSTDICHPKISYNYLGFYKLLCFCLEVTDLPVPHSEVLLLLQSVDERDQEVLVVEKSGEQGDSLLNVGPCCVGGLKTRGWVKPLFICATRPEGQRTHLLCARKSTLPPRCLQWPIYRTLNLSIQSFWFLGNLPLASSLFLSLVSAWLCDCLLNVRSWLNEPGLSMGATKQQHDGVFPLDCIHMVWFAAWQKESKGVH